MTNPKSFVVMDNINIPKKHHMKGFDSIGATILCGKNSIERIFWCGSILDSSHLENKLFTPTIVQVAAGVLSGLSFILEPERKPGYYEPCDLDTLYILNKSTPLLGLFYFTEIKKNLKK